MNKIKSKNKCERGITLIALIIAIIILIILAMVAIHAIYEFKIVDYAVSGASDYAKEAKKENEILDQTASDLRVAINKKPVFTKTELEEKTDTSIKTVACATDENNDKLVYTLYIGTTKDNLELKKTSDEIEQGTDVTLTTSISSTDKYYRVDVSDGVATIKGKVNVLAIIEVGSYVDYKPETGTFNMTDTEPSTGETYSTLIGRTSNNTYFSTEEFPWRIWDIDEENNKLVLIADGVTPNELSLEGAQGYNNGVKLLNDICKACYSNSNIGAVGRSFNIEDIEEKLITKPTYTSVQTYKESYNYYPIIHMYEEYSNIDGNSIPKGGQSSIGVKALTRSQQDRYYEATEDGATVGVKKAITSIAPTQTYINTSIAQAAFENVRYSYLTSKKGDSGTNLNFWLASRCAFLGSSTGCNFGVQCVSGGGLGDYNVFYSNFSSLSYVYAVRPIVEIPLNSIILGDDYGAGTEDDPFSISKI